MTKFTPGAGFSQASQQDWQDLAVQALKGRPVEKLVTKTVDGIEIQPIYPAPAEPHNANFTRSGHSGSSWTIMQRADIPDFSAANDQILDDLSNGANGICLILAGAVTASDYGLSIASAQDFKRVLENVELDLIDVRLDGAGATQETAQQLLQVYKDRNLDLSRCQVNFGIDPVADFALKGAAPDGDTLCAAMADLFRKCRDAGHKQAVFCADTRVYHQAGASDALELGFGLATLIEQLRLAEQADISPADFLGATSMMFAVGEDQFASIAKLRAAHVLWQRLLETVGAEPRRLCLETETSLAMMSRRDAHVNMLRTTTACFAAGVGGASSVTVLPYSSAAGLPDAFARRMARNQQTILLEESSIGRVSDATTGSGYVEAFTGELAEKGWRVMQEIEQAGGMFKALGDGVVAGLIQTAVDAETRALATRKQGIVGVSEFANPHDPPVDVLDYPAVEVPAQTYANGQTCDPLATFRPADLFESLATTAKQLGDKACVYLATLGSHADFAARATWVTNLFAAGGLDADSANTGAHVACICSSDAVYRDQAQDLARKLKNDGYKFVFLAGKPGDDEQALRAAGIDGFLYAGCNVLESLSNTVELIRKNAS